MPLLNDFLLGADPEFAIMSMGHLQRYTGAVPRFAPWGLDHNGYIIEPHPKPELSVRSLVKNIKTSLNDFALYSPEGKWRAGAYIHAPERAVTMGGHVHIDQQVCTNEQRDAMDLFVGHLEALEIMPPEECRNRRGHGYGGSGDIRVEHGHYEYRSIPSWLFSQRVTKLCLTGIKLLVVDPSAATEVLGTAATASTAKLRALFERFQNRDDDVDWLLSAHMLHKNLNVRPDRDLRDVWKVQPEQETGSWKEDFENARRARGVAAAREVAARTDREATQTEREAADLTEEVYPYITQVGHLYLARGSTAIPVTIEDARRIEVVIPQNPHLVIGSWHPIPNYRVYIWGFVGRRWEVSVATRPVRTRINNHWYSWRVMYTQRLNRRTRNVLRAFVEEGPMGQTALSGALILRSGLLFSYVRSEPVYQAEGM